MYDSLQLIAIKACYLLKIKHSLNCGAHATAGVQNLSNRSAPSLNIKTRTYSSFRLFRHSHRAKRSAAILVSTCLASSAQPAPVDCARRRAKRMPCTSAAPAIPLRHTVVPRPPPYPPVDPAHTRQSKPLGISADTAAPAPAPSPPSIHSEAQGRESQIFSPRRPYSSVQSLHPFPFSRSNTQLVVF